jgi:hypothetical protein
MNKIETDTNEPPCLCIVMRDSRLLGCDVRCSTESIQSFFGLYTEPLARLVIPVASIIQSDRLMSNLFDWVTEGDGRLPQSGSLMPDHETETVGDLVRTYHEQLKESERFTDDLWADRVGAPSDAPTSLAHCDECGDCTAVQHAGSWRCASCGGLVVPTPTL